MHFQEHVKPLLPNNCFIQPLAGCKNAAEIVKKGRGKKQKVIGFVNRTSAGITINISEPKIKKHVQTMILITGSTVLI